VAGVSDAGICPWALGSERERRYHDEEWGVPHRSDAQLLELLVLEGAQSGLSWATVLGKRERYREVFLGFDPERVAALTAADVDAMLADPGVVRHRGKLESAVGNARATLAVRASHGGLDAFVLEAIGGRRIRNAWTTMDEVPAQTPASAALSRALRRHGFRFVGPTTAYAFLQAAGYVNDHLVSCPRHAAVDALP
jgi:DNA-3-methyladenine glycosylase I